MIKDEITGKNVTIKNYKSINHANQILIDMIFNGCFYCLDCIDCHNCRDCHSDCRDCNYCHICRDCRDFSG